MTQLHELIAVEPDLKTKAVKDKETLTQALSHAQNFVGEVRVYSPLEEMGESYPDEVSNVLLSAKEVVKDFCKTFGNWLDVTLIKETTNPLTSADVIVDGEVIFKSLPSPALLNLESRLTEIRTFYAALPTLDMTEVWHYDENNEVWVSEPRKTFKSRKVLRNHVKAEATKEHPAQVDVYSEDIRIGEWNKIVKSGAITVKQKRDVLDRIDKLALAVKKARQRANSVDIVSTKFADAVFGYINGELF